MWGDRIDPAGAGGYLDVRPVAQRIGLAVVSALLSIFLSVPATVLAEGVTIASPPNGASVSGSVPLAINLGGRSSKARIYVDGAWVASTPLKTWSWDSSTVPDGTHVIAAKAFSSAGKFLGGQMLALKVHNTSGKRPTPTPTATAKTTPAPTVTPTVSATIAPTPVPTVAPTVTATATVAPTVAPTMTPTPTPAPVAVITTPLTGATVSGTVPITAQVSSAVAWTDYYVDGTYIASGPPYTYNWNSTTVSNGSHVLSVTAFGSSNASIGTSAVNVTVNNGGTSTTPTTTATPAPGTTATPTPAATATSTPIAASTTYYVDNSGSPACSDSGSGTSPTTPWCTVAKVVGVLPSFSPGDQVLFKCGDTWNEQMSIPTGVHGTASQPITIGHYGANCVLPNQTYTATLPIINGGGVRSHGIFADGVSVSHLIVDGFEVTETTLAGIGFVTPGCSGMPGIVIKNNLVHHFNAGAYTGATEGPSSTGSCTTSPSGGPGPCDPGDYDHDMGIGFNDDCASGGQDGVQILYNTVWDSGGHNTMRVHYDASPSVLVDHNLVGPGCFHNCIDTKAISGMVSNNITTCPAASARGHQCGNGTAGFYTENTQSWVSTPKWWNNVAYDIGMGIQAENSTSHPQIYSNTLYGIYGNGGLYLSTCSNADVEKNLLTGAIFPNGITTWNYNDDFGTTGALVGVDDLNLDPQYVAPSATPPDFHTSNSAVNSQGAGDSVTSSAFLGAMGP